MNWVSRNAEREVKKGMLDVKEMVSIGFDDWSIFKWISGEKDKLISYRCVLIFSHTDSYVELPQPGRDKTHAPVQWKCGVSTTGPSGKFKGIQ